MIAFGLSNFFMLLQMLPCPFKVVYDNCEGGIIIMDLSLWNCLSDCFFFGLKRVIFFLVILREIGLGLFGLFSYALM